MGRGNSFYFSVGMQEAAHPLPDDVGGSDPTFGQTEPGAGEWSPEDMEEADAEVQGILDTYYGTIGREE